MTQPMSTSSAGLLALAERPLDAWLDEPGQCRPCHGPIVPKTGLGMFRDWLCYRIVLWWPNRFFMSAPHAAILPYAGTHAFTCTCWPKVRAAALRARASQEQQQ
jgi:hypothetical protein